MDYTKFKISETQYIKINCEHIATECCFCVDVDILYIDEINNINIQFGNLSLSDIYCSLSKSSTIQEIIAGTLIFDRDLMGDIGIEWNKEEKSVLDQYYFAGNDHKGIPPYFESWIYRDKNNKIYFEITPCYPWHLQIKRSIDYENFVKNYKTTVKVEIPKDNLIAWGIQIEKLFNLYK